VDTQYAAVYDCCKRKEIKYLTTALPYARVSVLCLTLLIETIDLRDLPTFMVASHEGDAIRILRLQAHEEGKCFQGEVSPVDEIPQENVVDLIGHSSPDSEELQEIVKLPVYISAHCYRRRDRLDVGFCNASRHVSICGRRAVAWEAVRPSIKHSFTSSHSRFMSPSLRYLHFFAISSHSSGPPPDVGAAPPMSVTLIFRRALGGVATVKRLSDEREEEMSESEVLEKDSGEDRGRRDGRSCVSGMVASLRTTAVPRDTDTTEGGSPRVSEMMGGRGGVCTCGTRMGCLTDRRDINSGAAIR
jgi:hypothetical protein